MKEKKLTTLSGRGKIPHGEEGTFCGFAGGKKNKLHIPNTCESKGEKSIQNRKGRNFQRIIFQQ